MAAAVAIVADVVVADGGDVGSSGSGCLATFGVVMRTLACHWPVGQACCGANAAAAGQYHVVGWADDGGLGAVVGGTEMLSWDCGLFWSDWHPSRRVVLIS